MGIRPGEITVSGMLPRRFYRVGIHPREIAVAGCVQGGHTRGNQPRGDRCIRDATKGKSNALGYFRGKSLLRDTSKGNSSKGINRVEIGAFGMRPRGNHRTGILPREITVAGRVQGKLVQGNRPRRDTDTCMSRLNHNGSARVFRAARVREGLHRPPAKPIFETGYRTNCPQRCLSRD